MITCPTRRLNGRTSMRRGQPLYTMMFNAPEYVA